MFSKVKQKIESILISPIYFVLFSVYTILYLYVTNISGIPPKDLFRPLFLSLSFALFLYFVFWKITRQIQKSALLVFASYILFFFYGHFRNVLYAMGILIPTNILVCIWIALAILTVVLINKYDRMWKGPNIPFVLNMMVIVLLLFPIVQATSYVFAWAIPLDRKANHTVNLMVNANNPDIYYIILDGYTREDALLQDFGYDNSEFLNALKDMGFYVAECSQSNYSTTSLSLASSLNLDYLQNISDSYQPNDPDLIYSFQALESNVVRDSLENLGYTTITFEDGFYWFEWRDADYFLSPGPSQISDFEIVILLSTFARIVDDFDIINLDDINGEHYRVRTKFVLNSFDTLLDIPSPKLALVHLIAPHFPFVFDAKGNSVAPDRVNRELGYLDMTRYISSAILPEIKKLITESTHPFIIIVQGDHGRLGSEPAQHMKILNAYYMPVHSDQLYPTISPVNSFRVIFNSYFGTDFPLLDDISYYSELGDYYNFTIVPNSCP